MGNVLVVESVGRLRVLRLNRPERKNALNDELFQAITDGVREAAHDDDVWAVAITGNGDAFCSGLDLGSVAAAAPAEVAGGSGASDTVIDDADGDGIADDIADDAAEDMADNMAMLLRVECEKPVLAGVNGVAVGIGLSLAMCADMRIAAPSARMHPGYARVATSPDGGATWTLTQALGYEGAMRFFLEQRMLTADEALRIGMVGEVADTDAEFEARFLAYGELLAGVAPLASRQTKRLVGRASRPSDLPAHLREEIRLARRGLASDDSREAIRAMSARDQPVFRGR